VKENFVSMAFKINQGISSLSLHYAK